MNKNSYVGIFGGTFDPIHNGHLKLAKTAKTELNLDKVIFMPAYIPPHKQNKNVTPGEHRLMMTKLATSDMDYFDVSDLEMRLEGASYTARTLTTLKESYDRLVFIVGADSFMALDKWYHPEIIFEKAEIACAYRDGINENMLSDKAEEYALRFNAVCHVLHMDGLDVSSTLIREKLRKNIKPDGLIPESVYEYIKENGLYHEV